MAVPIKPNIAEKFNHAVRPSVPANQKEDATEFNLIVAAIRANYERLILNWTTDILANVELPVGQYVLYNDGSSDAVYRITTAYNVGNPITWNGANASVIISAGQTHFKGVYADETALTTAHPTAVPGDYALVDVGASEAQLWIWDDTDTEWIASGVTTVVTVDEGLDSESSVLKLGSLVPGTKPITTVRYITINNDGSLTFADSDGNAMMQVASDAAKSIASLQSVNKSNSEYVGLTFDATTGMFIDDSRAAPKGLEYVNDYSAGIIANPRSIPDIGSVLAYIATLIATQAQMITGTDNTKLATAKSVEDKRSILSKTISNGATGTTNIDCEGRQEVKIIFTNAITGAFEITFTNASNLEFISIVAPITGSNIVGTWPSFTRMMRFNEVTSGLGWNQSAKTLTVSSVGTADPWVFSLLKISSTPTYDLQYSGPGRA